MRHRLLLSLLASATVLLAACGGGGGGGTTLGGGSVGGGTTTSDGSGTGAGGPASGIGSPVVTPTPIASSFVAFGPVTIANNVGPQSPVIARLATGGTVVVWHTWGGTLNAQRLDVNGQAVGGPVQVAGAASQDTRPAVVPLAGGGFAVAWADAPSAVGSTSVLMRRFDANGAPTTAASQASTTVNGVGDLAAATLPDGGMALAWTATPLMGGVTRVAVQRFDANGAAVAQAQPAGTMAGEQRTPRLAVLADGSFVLGWLQAGSSSAVPSYSVTLQRFSAGGALLGGERVAATDNVAFGYAIAGLANGTMALVWQSFGTTSGVANLNLQLLAADGTPVAAATQLPDASGVAVADPNVASLGAAGFVVTWQRVVPFSIRELDATVNAQRFSPAGAALEQPQQLATYALQTTTGQATGRSSIAGGADGHFVMAYDRWLAGSFIDALGR